MKSDEQLVFTDNPMAWRMGGIVMISLATMVVIAFWRYGEQIFGPETLLLTLMRAVVGLGAVIIGVLGFSLARLPVRILTFDRRRRVLHVNEKFLFSRTNTAIPFNKIVAVTDENMDLENATAHFCYLELADDERVEVPTPKDVNETVVAELRRDIAVYIGLES